MARRVRTGAHRPGLRSECPGRAQQRYRRSVLAGDAGAADLSRARRSALQGGSGEAPDPRARRARHDLPLLGPLPPAERYLYDEEIVPRVALFIQRDDRFQSTSVWILGQRRRVYLKGCVASQAQSDELERKIRLIDDVEAVINELMVGTSAAPRYDVDRNAN